MRRFLLIALPIAVLLAVFYVGIVYIPTSASRLYGPPAARLTISQRIQYSALLLTYGGELLTPRNPAAPEQDFTVEPSESVASVANRLEVSGIISNAGAFRDYLIYTGMDITLQAGTYKLNPSMSMVDIAREMQDATPEDITLTILPGWRMEEIALSLPTSGLNITPEDFVSAARNPPPVLTDVPASASMEGFFFPDSYILPRVSTVDQVLEAIARNFAQHMTDDLRAGYSAQGLSVYEGVTLASIVEREAVQEEEQTLIASVFLNRLRTNMQLGSDPTVQYALGYDPLQLTWWKNPLSLDDLQVNSPYNTYANVGLPPGPISNPSLDTLRAVAFPVDSPYYFFRAKCDDGGYHIFAETFDEHLQNACP
ncbi:MAG: endolytic transglycosylase MltG [Chloroflexota bacterium]